MVPVLIFSAMSFSARFALSLGNCGPIRLSSTFAFPRFHRFIWSLLGDSTVKYKHVAPPGHPPLTRFWLTTRYTIVLYPGSDRRVSSVLLTCLVKIAHHRVLHNKRRCPDGGTEIGSPVGGKDLKRSFGRRVIRSGRRVARRLLHVPAGLQLRAIGSGRRGQHPPYAERYWTSLNAFVLVRVF